LVISGNVKTSTTPKEVRMIRGFGLTGAMGMLLVASAIAAPTALAVPQFTASAYPATATGSNTAGNESFTTEAGTVQCDSHFVGTLSEASSTFTDTPTYSNCVAFGFLSATINTEGCTFTKHITIKISLGVFSASLTIGCPAGKSIKIVSGTCKAEIKSQNLESIKLTNSGSSITVQPNVTNIAITVTQDGFGCPFNGTGNKTGSYHGDLLMSRVGGGSISASGE